MAASTSALRAHGQGAHVDLRRGARRNDVGGDAALNHGDRNRSAVLQVVHLVQRADLLRQLDDGVDTLLGRVAGVRGAALRQQVVAGNALAPGFQRAFLRGGLHHQHEAAVRRRFHNQLFRVAAAQFLVAGDQHAHRATWQLITLDQAAQGRQHDDDAALHVDGARAEEAPFVIDARRARGQRAQRPDCVAVRQEQDGRAWGVRMPASQPHVAHFLLRDALNAGAQGLQP